MSLKTRLIILNFLQYFIWGSWLITIGGYWFNFRGWEGVNFGAVFSTMGIASIFVPPLTGILVDKWIRAERLLGIMHLGGAVCLFLLPIMSEGNFFWMMLVCMCFYMPTISLSITVGFSSLKREGLDVVKVYPPIRVWGTVGFIAAMWTVSLFHFEKNAMQFVLAGVAAVIMGIYSFTMPACPPLLKGQPNRNWVESLGLQAFVLFKQTKMAMFFIFCLLLGASLQLTNAYGDTFLHDFEKIPAYKELLAVKYPAIIMSISQISETLFILAIPFMMYRFGIKKVMLFSMIAWVFRFGLFAYGNPAEGLWMIILSCIIYGLAFDFFNISGSLFVETQTDKSIRGSAQGVFMMMTNGFGAVIGSNVSAWAIKKYFMIDKDTKDWHNIWLAFAAYALIVAVLFFFLFKHKHDPKELEGKIH
jgi:MFS transporter, NHS family, xanthosine permease